MQETEKGRETKNTLAPADLNSQPLQPVILPEVDETDDDPDTIFLKAVAEIDTQPLPRRRIRLRWQDVLQSVFCLSLLVGSIAGMVYQLITYPKTLVILYAQEKPAALTTPLDIPTRTLAPITLIRQLTTSTTGHGHQDATHATGTLTLYNGSFSSQTLNAGTVYTGSDGVQVATDQPVTIPAANPPYVGQATVTAHTIHAGGNGNIPAGDIHITGTTLQIRNTQFQHGQDARDFQAVAPQDTQSLTLTVQKTLETAFTTAFTVRPGEQAQPTNCHTTTTANHKVGDEAHTVTLNGSETCSAIAYSQSQLQRVVTQLFTAQTAPGKHYKLVGSLTATIVSVTPLTVSLLGSWVYVLSSDEQESFAQAIQGETPAQARKYLFSTGVISSASVPDTLPAAMYINFLVLVGK